MNSRVKLIRDYFELSGSEAVREIKALSNEDKDELGSAIARDSEIAESECEFEFVSY